MTWSQQSKATVSDEHGLFNPNSSAKNKQNKNYLEGKENLLV